MAEIKQQLSSYDFFEEIAGKEAKLFSL